MRTAEIDLQKPFLADPYVLEIKNLCRQIAEVKPQDTQTLFGDLHRMAALYYEGALTQARQSFKAAQISAAVGTALFVIAVALWMRPGTNLSWLSVLPGAMIQVISGLNFYMYRKATKQFELFHVCLERMGRYLMANSVCANIENSGKRDEARIELVTTMAHAPMLPIEGSHDQAKDNQSQSALKTHVASKAATA